MAHLFLAACAAGRPVADRIEAWLRAQHGPLGALAETVSRLDLESGPKLDRVMSILGIGWHGREKLGRAERAAGRAIDAALEVCGCGRHHLMSLGRAGPPAARWTATATWIDRLAGREGAHVLHPGPTLPSWTRVTVARLDPTELDDETQTRPVAAVLTAALLRTTTPTLSAL